MRITKLYCLIFLISAVYCNHLYAQRILTLQEAIATALQNNYDIRLAKNDSLVAAIDYSYRNSVFYPNINANASTLHNNNNQKQTLADGTERKSNNIASDNVQGSIALDWVLFDGLKMFATKQKIASLLEAGQYAYKEQLINTIANIVNIYYSIARNKQQIKATDVQIDLNIEKARLAQNKLDIGVGIKPDVLQSKVDLNSQKALRMQQVTELEQLKEQLVQAMNTKITPAEFDVLDSIPLNYDISLADVQENIDRTNPTLQLAGANIDVANYTLKESKAGRWPTISFNSSYNYSRTSNKKVINPFSTLFNKSNGYNYGFTASIPIFNQFFVKKQIKKDELNLDMQKLNYENQRSLIYLYILNAYKNYDQQKRSLALEEENIQLANENVSIVFQTYKLGMATLVQLREAQLSQAQAYDRLIQARYNTKLAEVELMRLKGDIIKGN